MEKRVTALKPIFQVWRWGLRKSQSSRSHFGRNKVGRKTLFLSTIHEEQGE